ncbi:solute carrier family 15 member 2-like isoform X2 [Lineus longissimus]|uniref:solute carrier family 15 member 2-like isoform X2 n=1 Tax=Lineus longissimus TaxID=88925 RepID=UPI002B4DBFBD
MMLRHIKERMAGSDNSEDELFSKDPNEDKERRRLLNSKPVDGSPAEEPTRWDRFKGCCSCHGYPIAVFFIIMTEFCERFSFYGMRTVLTLYLKNFLGLSGNVSTEVFHGFNMICYFMPLLGAIVADGYIGKFKTVVALSTVYVAGNIVMAVTAIPPAKLAGAVVGLVLIGIGTGGIKPCVSAFGGDQFAQGQEKQLAQFFSIFYFSINAGALISTFVTPILREDVECFGGQCFFAAFGLPALLMLTAIVIFVAGRSMYKVNPPSGNIIGMFFKCIWSAVGNKVKAKKEDQRESVLDYADDRFSKEFVLDVKGVLRVLVMYLPIPVFWALYDQQGSTWTLQAEKMDGHLGGAFRIKPDQMQAINTVLIIVLIPLFEGAIYPLLDKCRIPNRPLQRMCCGMVLAACAFVFAAFIQFRIDASELPAIKQDYMRGKFINDVPCPTKFTSEFQDTTLKKFETSERFDINSGARNLRVSIISTCPSVTLKTDTTLKFTPGYDISLIAGRAGNVIQTKQIRNDLVKPRGGNAKVRFIYMPETPSDQKPDILLSQDKLFYIFPNVTFFEPTEYKSLEALGYSVKVKQGTEYETLVDRPTFQMGGCYTVVIHGPSSHHNLSVYTDVPPNTVSMMLQIPQYVIITTGEILLSVTGLSFSYAEAPNSMKSVLQAFWLMTVAFGNLIVLLLAIIKISDNVAICLFFYAGLMGIDIIIFGILACFYKYKKDTIPQRDDETELREDREEGEEESTYRN